MISAKSDNDLAVKMVYEELESLREQVPDSCLVKEAYFKNRYLAGQNLETAQYRQLMDFWKALLRLRSNMANETRAMV